MSIRYLILITGCCCFCAVATAQNSELIARGHRGTQQAPTPPAVLFTLPQFTGRWQEIKRTGPNKKAVTFTDTTLIHFYDGGTVETRRTTDDKMDIRMVEKASIDDENVVMTAEQDYTALSITKDAMVLQDQDDSIHSFKKVAVFPYEVAAGYTPPATISTTPETAVATISLAKIMGEWDVYKREAKPGFVTSSTVLIKALNLTKKVDNNTANGIATIYQGEVSQQLPCTVIIHGSNIKIIVATVTFDLPVKVADGKEFDFGTSDMMYYCKQL